MGKSDIPNNVYLQFTHKGNEQFIVSHSYELDGPYWQEKIDPKLYKINIAAENKFKTASCDYLFIKVDIKEVDYDQFGESIVSTIKVYCAWGATKLAVHNYKHNNHNPVVNVKKTIVE